MTDQANVLETALTAHWLTQVVMTLHQLGIPTQLQRGTQNLGVLADTLESDTRALWQLLSAAEKLGVVTQDEQGNYQLTVLGMRLLPEREDSLIPFLDHIISGYRVWGELPHSIRSGDSAFAKVHGVGIYDYLAQHSMQNTFFNRYMAQTTDTWLVEAGKYYDFTGHVIDLGGNKGALSAMLLKQFPALQTTVFDLPHAVEQAKPLLAAAGVAARCRVIGGSFFDAYSIPADGDIYLLSRVLLNWNDEQVINILQNCRYAMPAGSKLLILELILNASAELNDYLSSLNLLVMFGARMRTQAEFESLLSQAGFTQVRWISAGAGESPLFYLEASPI